MKINDILKLKELLKKDILEEIRDDLSSIKNNMATKDQITKVIDILARHESYIKSEQEFIIAHIDRHDKEIEEIRKHLNITS